MIILITITIVAITTIVTVIATVIPGVHAAEEIADKMVVTVKIAFTADATIVINTSTEEGIVTASILAPAATSTVAAMSATKA